MAQTYTFQISGDPEEKFRQVQKLARSRGVTLDGNSTTASFCGMVKGSFSRSGSTVTVTITDKSFFVSWATVESTIRGFLES